MSVDAFPTVSAEQLRKRSATTAARIEQLGTVVPSERLG